MSAEPRYCPEDGQLWMRTESEPCPDCGGDGEPGEMCAWCQAFPIQPVRQSAKPLCAECEWVDARIDEAPEDDDGRRRTIHPSQRSALADYYRGIYRRNSESLG